jgi:hypothetical protein
MMDALEAIKGLDGYSETLLSLNALLGAKMFDEKSDEHGTLLAQIKQKQTDGRWIVFEILKDIHHVGTKADRSGDLTGIGAAIERYVAADSKVNEGLKKTDKAAPPGEIAEAVNKFWKSAGL